MTGSDSGCTFTTQASNFSFCSRSVASCVMADAFHAELAEALGQYAVSGWIEIYKGDPS